MVPELLSEQIEAADVIVINKVDLAGEEQVKVATNLVKALNDKAITFEVNYGEISVKDVIGALSVPTKKDTDDTACDDPTCDDPTHEHAHSHVSSMILLCLIRLLP
jgi:G3E family GTPase